MAECRWLHEVQTALASSQVTDAYRRRLVEELSDHLEDVLEERNFVMSTEALQDQALYDRLGTADEIVRSAKVNLPESAFARRHPYVTYLVAPVPVLIVSWIAYLAALIGIVNLIKPAAIEPWHGRVAGIVISGMAYIPTLVVVLAITWIAARSHSKLRWWLAGALPVALLSALLIVGFQMPTAPGTGKLSVGFGMPPGLGQLPQFLIPMIAATACMLFVQLRRRQAAALH